MHACGLRGASQAGCYNVFPCEKACVALTVPKHPTICACGAPETNIWDELNMVKKQASKRNDVCDD